MKNIENIKLSKATIDDAKDLQELTALCSKGMYMLCGWSEEEINMHFNPQKITEGAERLKNSIPTFTENDILLIAKDIDNQIVGYCFATKEENENKIEGIYLLPDYQGSGLAQKLFDSVYDLFNKNKDTFLDVFSSNSKAINFYRKLGFYETGKKHLDERFKNSNGEKLEITEMILDKK